MTIDNESRILLTLTDIAREHLSISTLETRHSDSLDFYDMAVWCIRRALLASYETGYKNGKENSRKSQFQKNNKKNKINSIFFDLIKKCDLISTCIDYTFQQQIPKGDFYV